MARNTLTYKGYSGVVEFDGEAGVLHGRVVGLRDVVTFQGETVAETRQAFQDSVDDYLEWCQELGHEPERPCSGELRLRMTPERHRAVTTASAIRGESINACLNRYIQGGLEKEMGRSSES